MSDWLLLGVLAAGFYLYECCTWTPAAVFACVRKPFRNRWTAAPGAELTGNESGGFAFSDPFTLSGNIIHCAHWPCSVHEHGVCIETSDAPQYWPFESIRTIDARDRAVRFNRQAVINVSSEAIASELAGVLERLRVASDSMRASAAHSSIAQSFDPDMLEAEWSRFTRASRALRGLAALPLIWLAVVTPLALFVFGPLASWPYLLGGLFLGAIAVAAEFVRVHKREVPNGSDRWVHAISMSLFPIAAIRAADRISKERFAAFDPCTVVGMFCNDAAGDAMLRRFGYDLDHPATQPASDDPRIDSCRNWYRSQQRAAFKGLLKSLKRDPFTAPAKLEGSEFYCPRCHSQFTDNTEPCSDCDDVTLVSLISSPAAEAAEQKPRKRKRA